MKQVLIDINSLFFGVSHFRTKGGRVIISLNPKCADFFDKANVVTGRQRKLPKESLDKTLSRYSTVGLACLQLAPVMERYSLSDRHPDPLTSWVSRFCVGF